MQATKEKAKGKRFVHGASARSTDPNHPVREKRRSESYSNGKIGSHTNASGSSSFCHVTGSLKERIQAQLAIRQDKMGLFLSQITPIVCAHTDFKDRDWQANADINDVLRHTICEFQRLTPEDLAVFFQIDDDRVTPYWIYECKDCYSYGNLLSCQWLRKLSKKHRKLYRLAIDFLSFCFHNLDMAIWNEYDEECQIEFILEEMDYREQTGEIEREDVKSFKKDISYFRRYAVGHYANLVYRNKITIEAFEQRLNDYKPRKRKYRKFKKWMLQSIEICRLGFNFKEVDCPFIVPDDFYTNGELEPYRYVRFIWDDSDHIGRSLIEGIDDVAGNCGIIPLMEFDIVTKDHIEDPSGLFGKSQRFFDWMSAGHQITDSL